jgi:hypothetical protein
MLTLFGVDKKAPEAAYTLGQLVSGVYSKDALDMRTEVISLRQKIIDMSTVAAESSVKA